MKLQLLTLVAALALAGAAMAYPSLAGPTGGLDTATAQIAPVGEVQFALDWVNDPADAVWAARGVYGLSNNVEVGISYFDDGPEGDLGLHAKYVFSRNILDAAWAVGFVNIEDADLQQGYVAATRQCTPRLQGTAGLQYNSLDGDEDLLGFLNAEYVLGQGVLVGADGFIGGEIDDYANLYLRYQANERLGVQFGLQQVFKEDIFNFGASVNF